MKTVVVPSPLGEVQQTFDFPEVVETSPIGNGFEHEQRYRFATVCCREEYQRQITRIRNRLPSKNRDVRPFSGIDYCIGVTREGTSFNYRLRTGDPVNRRFGLKMAVPEKPHMRREVEFDLHPDTPIDNPLEFLRISTGKGENFTELHIRKQGTIFYFSHEDAHRIEVVISTAENLLKPRKRVVVGEIEAHGFEDAKSAEASIEHYEAILGWAAFRTNLNMCQLVS